MNRLAVGLFLLLIPLAAWSESYKRSVAFEWEPIAGAQSYELQIIKLTKDAEEKAFTFISQKPEFNGKLIPGRYNMKLRSRDRRGIAGTWAAPSPFDVPLEKVRITAPKEKAKILAKNETEEEITFSWKEVGGADGYLFELTGDSGKIQIKEEVKGTEFKTKVPVARNFTWKISALGADGLNSEDVVTSPFIVFGQKISRPKIDRPENEFVRDVKWIRPPFAESYDFLISRFNPKTKKWENQKNEKNFTADKITFDSRWPGGRYKIVLRAKAQLRENSEIVSEVFNVRNGDRSPAAEYIATVRKSIDRVNGWYALASYFITEIGFTSNYRNLFLEPINFKAIGGTGRLGGGWMSENNPWGFISIADLGGFIYNKKVSTYASIEASAIHRILIADRDEFRTHLGLFYKETPQSLPDIDDPQFASQASSGAFSTVVKNQATLGPHLGFEYWRSLTPKLGLQFNTHFYYSSTKVSTPSGGAIKPSLSTQVGLMGSYRMSKRFTGLTGLTFREENSSYIDDQSLPVSGNNVTNEVTTKIQGFYLSFYAEYAF